MNFGYQRVESKYPYSSLFIHTNDSEIKNIIHYCLTKKVPLVLFAGYVNQKVHYCLNCNAFIANMISDT